MWFGIITLFPDMFASLNYGIVGRALKNRLIEVNFYNPRDFTADKHHHVDDRPYGGGAGMVMMAKPLHAAIHTARQDRKEDVHVIYLSPQGRPLDHAGVQTLLARQNLVMVCGRYEGIDERLLEQEIDEEWSIGDYVLSGGEFAAMVVIDCITRQLPDALGHDESASSDSFATGLLDHPQYTRPEMFNGACVPNVLLSGDHAAIRQWRMKQALAKTWQKRPDMLDKVTLTAEQQRLLDEIRQDKGKE